MLIVDKAAASGPRPLNRIELGRGAVAYARALDAWEVKLAIAEARAELNAITAGAETKRDWASLTADRRATLQSADDGLLATTQSWMANVLMAAMSVERLEGVVDREKRPIAPSFELFELLFTDAEIEARFKVSGGRIERLWAEEKNGSGPGPGGSGPADTISAAPAKTPATDVRAADGGSSLILSGAVSALDTASAPSANTPPEAPKASSPATSPPAPDSGSMPA
jgi:hypothetical protein